MEKCPLCGSTDCYTSFIDKPSNVSINVCNSCYLVYQKRDNKKNYYNIECGTTKVIDQNKHTKDVANYIFDFSKEFLPSVNSVLEIGAYSSDTLNHIKTYFSKNDLKLCGLDLPVLEKPNPHPGIKMVYNDFIDRSNKSTVKRSLTTTPFGKNFNYDFIYCRHVLEHFRNPIKAVKNTYNLLSKDGVAFFEVPSFLWTEVNNVPTYDIEHLTYFTKETLSHLFITSGFEVLKIKESKYWGNIKILVKKANKSNSVSSITYKNSFKRKKIINYLHPIFIFLKRNF